MKEIRKLNANDIEVKVKNVSDGKALLLLYKTARVDMAILDEVFGPLNWTSEYREIKGNLFCGIGIRDSENQAFIYKWDCGIESKEDSEGNEKKGEASDAFKRAGFKIGIGRELYTTPLIFIDVETVEKNGKHYLKDKYARFNVKTITYDNENNIDKIIIIDKYKNQVYPKIKGNKQVENELPIITEKPLNLEPKKTASFDKKQTIITSEELEKASKLFGERADLLDKALALSTIQNSDVEKWIEKKSQKTLSYQDLFTEKVSEELFKDLLNSMYKYPKQKQENETLPWDKK